MYLLPIVGSFVLVNLYNESRHSDHTLDQKVIITFQVQPSSMVAEDLPRFNPARPDYLADVFNYPSPNKMNISLKAATNYMKKETCIISVGHGTGEKEVGEFCD